MNAPIEIFDIDQIEADALMPADTHTAGGY